MSDSIVVALIGLAGSAVGSLLGIFVSQKLTQYRLELLEKKMDSHGMQFQSLTKRVSDLEKHNEVQDERMRVANHRIEDLERKAEHE